MSRSPNLYEIRGPHDVSFFVRRIPLSLEALKLEAQQDRYLPARAIWREATVANLRAELVSQREGRWPRGNIVISHGEESYVISGNDGTPQIKSSAGNSYFQWKQKEIPPDESNTRLLTKILSTFRFNDLPPAEWLTYHDPAGRFSFEFRSDWRQSGGLRQEPVASVHGKTSTWIGVYVIAQMPVDEFRRAHGITKLTPKTAWFAHQLPGWRGLSNGHTAYLFERGTDLVVLNIFRTDESEETMTHFFNSFTLGQP